MIVVALIEACQGDRRTAFTIVTLFWMIGGALLLLLVCTVEADEQRVQDTVRASLLRTHLALASADPTNGVHVPVAEHCEVCGKVISSGVSVTETLSAIITVRFEAVPSAFCACRGRQGSSTDCTSHSYGTLDDISILEDSADRTSKP